MFKKLDAVEKRFHEVEHQLQNPGLSPDDLRKLSKEHADLHEVVGIYAIFKKSSQDLKDAKELLSEESDEEILSVAISTSSSAVSGANKFTIQEAGFEINNYNLNCTFAMP